MLRPRLDFVVFPSLIRAYIVQQGAYENVEGLAPGERLSSADLRTNVLFWLGDGFVICFD